MAHQKNITRETTHRLARRVLFGFLITFLLMRTLVYLIMSKTIPDSYVFVHGTHIHHFSEGIFMLALISGYLIFAMPKGRALEFMALFYGTAMALTFDEFGMWLNVDVTYWQRISIDMVFIIMTILGIIAYMPSWQQLNLKKGIILAVLFLGYVTAARMVGTSHFRAVYGAEVRQMQQSFNGPE